jgi:hypothetical protein
VTNLTDGLSARLLRLGEEEELLELLQEAFSHWPGVETDATPLEHLRWKLGSGDCARHIVLEEEGRLVAAMVCLFLPIKLGEETVVGRRFVDIAVRPGLQGRGLYGRLRREFVPRLLDPLHDVQISGGAHEAVVRVAEGRPGRRLIANRVEALVRPLGRPETSSPAGSIFRSAGRAAALTALVALSRLRYPPPPRRGVPIDIVDLSRFDSAVDGLWREASSQFDFAVVRDQRYLSWRYADPRAGRFRTRAVLADGEMLGYAVSRVTRGRGYVCDLLALPGRLDVAAALLEDSVAYLRTRKVGEAELWLARRHPYYALARRQGFVAVRRPPNFGFEALRLPAERVAFLDDARARVHLTIGDTDLV